MDQTTALSLLELDCDNSNNINDPETRPHSILLQFLRYLDLIFFNAAIPEFLSSSDEVKPKNHLKQFQRKISRFVLELFRRPIFAEFDDDSLHLICPQITMDYFNRQIGGLFYRFKDPSTPMSPHVISDHINSLSKLSIGSQLITQAHEHVLSIYSRRNDFHSASRYIRLHKISSNLFTPTNGGNSKLVKADVTTAYTTKLTIENGIQLVETEEQFNECIEQIQVCFCICINNEKLIDAFFAF